MGQLLRRVVITACLFSLFTLIFTKAAFADVTLTTQTVAAANLPQGSSNNIVYVVKMDVTLTPITVNNIQFTLGGTYDNNDLSAVTLYFNPSSPSLTGAVALVGLGVGFTAPHAYSAAVSQTVAAGASGYFIITSSLNATATAGNTIKVNGLANPMVFGFTSSPIITNNQSDLAGVQTISAASVTVSSVSVAAANTAQGATNVIAYIAKMDVTVLPVNINNIQFTLGGTYDNNDLSAVTVYFNPTSPSLTGAVALVGLGVGFTAPHAYSGGVSQTVAAGTSGYFIVTFGLNATATAGNTVKVDGLANPMVFSFTTGPSFTNNQTDVAGVQTFIAGAVSVSSTPVAASNVAQGTSNVIAYIAKMDVTGLPVTVNNIQFTLGGTYDNNDLSAVTVYFNPTTPSLTGAVALVGFGVGFAGPHTYSGGAGQPLAAGTSGYFIVTFGLNATATAGNTVKVDGLANPIVFSFTTGPSFTNNQTDAAGVQTFVAGAVSVSSTPVAASNVAQSASNVIAYIAKMDVTGLPVTINNIQFTLGGTYDNNDLAGVSVYFNATTPSLTGATVLSGFAVGFAGPHTYSGGVAQPLAAGTSGYFIVTFSLNAAATAGNTVKVDGLANPMVFSFTTGPSVTNNQTDVAGVQTFVAGAVSVSSSPVAASNVAQGASNVIAYIAKMDVTGLPVSVNNIQFTLGGTYDNNDLAGVSVYFNATTPSLTGATVLSGFAVGFAGPHTYSGGVAQPLAAGTSGYFIVTFNLGATATAGNTVKVDGLANPIVFSFTTSPSFTNNQTDVAGVQTMQAAGVTLTSAAVPAANITQGSSNNIVYALKADVTNLPVTVNNIQFTLTGTHDNNDLGLVGVWFNANTPSLTGATLLINTPGTFAAPHTYSMALSQPIAAGGTGYFIVAVNLDAAATAGNTVILNGATNPVVLSFTTAPPVTNNQTNAAGAQTFISILPLRLLSFNGSVNRQQSVLQWQTADEINTQSFEVEWSTNGIDFTSVSNIPSTHNSTTNKTYTYVHRTPNEGVNYYRLKMIDQDGHYTYSATVKVNMRFTATLVAVYPNPVTDVAVLHIQADQNSTLQLQLLATDGALLQTKTVSLNKGNNRFEWNMQPLPKGVYTIAATNQSIIPVHVVRN